MLHFIQEVQYSDELAEIEPDSDKADKISRRVEAACSLAVPTINAYGVSRFQHGNRHLIVWYSTDGSTVSLLSIRLDVARMGRGESVSRVEALSEVRGSDSVSPKGRDRKREAENRAPERAEEKV